jgi:hypothetical protein
MASGRLGRQALAKNHPRLEGEPAEEPSFKDEERVPISRSLPSFSIMTDTGGLRACYR